MGILNKGVNLYRMTIPISQIQLNLKLAEKHYICIIKLYL